MSTEYKQITLFEDDYLERTTGNVMLRPDVALTELIANAWDAGATEVSITIPEESNEKIIIEDNGTGMTEEDFQTRWMTLSYNRIKNQGLEVEFPKNVLFRNARKAYGKNGIGRHSMFCFNDTYFLETWKDGMLFSCDISTSSGDRPFKVFNAKTTLKDGNGTKLSAFLKRNIPNISKITEVLSARYLYDPNFIVKINGKRIELEDYNGKIKEEIIEISNKIKLKISIINSGMTAKKSVYHGVAFWVGKRLVGEPSWTLGKYMIRDGRTIIAKSFTIIVETEGLEDEVLQDWTGFKNSEIMDVIFKKVAEYVNNFIREINREKIDENKLEIVREKIDDIKNLSLVSQSSIATFIEEMVEREPEKSIEELQTAVEVMINIEKSKSGKELLQKISQFSTEDIDTLNSILENWSVNDIKTTLDNIDQRIMVIEAIERLCDEKSTDELHTLHPLVAQAKWIFGPEYDSDEFTFNRTLKTVIKDVFKSIKYKEINEPNRRPDLVIFEDITVAGYQLEDYNNETELNECKKILIIELKKGGFEIGQEEMSQAQKYVNAIFKSSSINAKPTITAYVVGSKVSDDIERDIKLGETKNIHVCTYSQLVSTAGRRLFRLKEILNDRYINMATENIVTKVLKEPKQRQITIENLQENNASEK